MRRSIVICDMCESSVEDNNWKPITIGIITMDVCRPCIDTRTLRDTEKKARLKTMEHENETCSD